MSGLSHYRRAFPWLLTLSEGAATGAASAQFGLRHLCSPSLLSSCLSPPLTSLFLPCSRLPGLVPAVALYAAQCSPGARGDAIFYNLERLMQGEIVQCCRGRKTKNCSALKRSNGFWALRRDEKAELFADSSAAKWSLPEVVENEYSDLFIPPASPPPASCCCVHRPPGSPAAFQGGQRHWTRPDSSNRF